MSRNEGALEGMLVGVAVGAIVSKIHVPHDAVPAETRVPEVAL